MTIYGGSLITLNDTLFRFNDMWTFNIDQILSMEFSKNFTVNETITTGFCCH